MSKRSGGQITPAWVVVLVYLTADFFLYLLPLYAKLVTLAEGERLSLLSPNPSFGQAAMELGQAIIGLAGFPVIIIPLLLTAATRFSTPDDFKFWMGFFYVLQVLVFSNWMFPTTWKHVFYHFVAMTSGEPDMTAKRAEDHAEIVKQERQVGGQIDHVRSEVKALSRELPGAPEPPATLLEFGSYLEQIRKQAQSYVQGKTLERRNAVLEQMTVYYGHWLTLEKQMDAIRHISETRDVRDIQRKVEQAELELRLHQISNEHESLESKARRMKEDDRRYLNPEPPSKPQTIAEQMFKEAKNIVELRTVLLQVRRQFAEHFKDDPDLEEDLDLLYDNMRKRLTRSDD